jgi:ABC-type antimicrobial peptide transport system permease subunit
MSALVRERTREIAVRSALGATPARLRQEVLSESLRVAVAGTAVGLAAALSASRLVASVLYEVSPADPLALGGACLLLLAVAVVATLLPADRVTRIDPATALRS